MDVVEHFTLCENILNKSLDEDKKHHIKSFEDKEGNFVLKFTTGEEDFTFNFHLVAKEDSARFDTTGYNKGFYYNEEKNTIVEIKDVAVKGYVSVDFQEIDTTHLKAVLKSLSRRYAKEIKENKFEESFRSSYFLSHNYDNFLDDLFNITEVIDSRDIDKQLLKEGIKTIIFTGGKALALNENILYINGDIFQKKFFFKELEDGSTECKILNTGPSTPLPLVYDVLLVIFYFTDQEGRQKTFHELVKYFYISLEEESHKLDFDIATILPLQKYEMHIRTFIVLYVKLEMAHYYYHQLEKDPKYKKLLLGSILELNECVLYPNLTREDCYEIVRNKIETSTYKFLGYKLVPLEERAGMMGDYFKLKINIRHDDLEETIHLFAKYVPTTIDFMQEASLSIFKKEEFIYATLIPEFIRIGLEDIVDFSPKCYFLRPNDVIILEDLSESNYKSLDSKVPLCYKALQLVVKKLARLHACSLLYEEISSQEYGEEVRIDEKYGEYIEENFFKKAEEKLEKLHNVGIATVINSIIGEFPDVAKGMSVDEFRERARLVFDSMFEKVKRSDKYRNVLCHGDIWTTNILFKMDSKHQPTDCRIVDYQLTRYCPPTHDLLCLLYVNTNQETRVKYMSKLVDEYYAEVMTVFLRHGCNLDEAYPYEIFLESCNYMRPQSVCQAALYYQTSLCPDIIASLLTDREKFDSYCLVDRQEVMKQMLERESFRMRFKEIIEELYDICLDK